MQTFSCSLLLLMLITGSALAQTDLGADRYLRIDRHDGYVLGNGQMYTITALGKALERKGKSRLTDRPAPLSRIAWLIGPSYPVGNLGYGWEAIPIAGRDTLSWAEERIVPPGAEQAYWGLRSSNEMLDLATQDILLHEEPVFIREMELTAREDGYYQLFLPVWPDPRNGYFPMFSGREVDAEQVERWTYLCGPNLKPRASIAPDRMRQVFPDEKALVLVGANRALWQEVSTIVPPDEEYRAIFPYRAAAAGLVPATGNVKLTMDERGHRIDFGWLEKGERRKCYLLITTVSQAEREGLEQKALDYLQRQKDQGIAALLDQAQAAALKAPFTFPGQPDHPLTRSINSCLELSLACQAENGGVMAQPYMYPMYYVRDQYGSYRLLLAAGEYEKAYDILRFYIAKENRDGIQNAHDPFPGVPDPTIWDPGANARNGHHANAEVPSYIILMARDYYRATGDDEGLRPFYERLKYNLEVQKLSRNGILPYEGDESYTNSPQTRPKFGEEMTDSHLLYLAAAEFMVELAEALAKPEDAQIMGALRDAAWKALYERLVLEEEGRLIYARDDSDSLAKRDLRPALDMLLRWYHLEMGDPNDRLARANLRAVLEQLVDPLRVVPEYDWCTGMDLGYLLYALSRSQRPEMHAAARLMMRYASEIGLYSEYYRYRGDTILSESGTLRPWESGVNGMALIQYLSGMRQDRSKRMVYLQPHLPPEVNTWQSKAFPLYGQGHLQMRLERSGDEVRLSLKRSGGTEPFTFRVDFGQFGGQLEPLSRRLRPRGSDRLQAELQVGGEDEQVLQFRIRD